MHVVQRTRKPLPRVLSEMEASTSVAAAPPQYRAAARAISTPAALQRFLASPVCDDLVAFILALNTATRGLPNDAIPADVRTPPAAAAPQHDDLEG
jgi:hypothetical protein